MEKLNAIEKNEYPLRAWNVYWGAKEIVVDSLKFLFLVIMREKIVFAVVQPKKLWNEHVYFSEYLIIM